MAMNNAASRVLVRLSAGNKSSLLLARSFISGQSLCAKNSQNKGKGKAKKTEVKNEAPAIPQDQKEYEKFISTYRNEEQFNYNDYSYYEIENELLQHRQPQPKKPALY